MARDFANRRVKLLALAGLAVVVLAAGLATWRYIAYNLWAERDAASLTPYSIVLVGEGAAPSSETAALDEEVIRYNSRGRLVAHLSRSEYRRSLTGKQVWVKIYLETQLPKDPTVVEPIKLMNTLERRKGEWHVTHTTVLTIP
ncbi:hypothetical protein KQI84_11405 [bacterium]|nr:hypothetical protein [bacterium]